MRRAIRSRRLWWWRSAMHSRSWAGAKATICGSQLRWGSGDAEKLKAFAKELVSLRPDAILSMSTVATGFVVRETNTIPIVFVGVADPIGSGFVANLARPGGDVTGFMTDISAQGGKW